MSYGGLELSLKGMVYVSYVDLRYHKYERNIIYVVLHWELGHSNIFEILVKRIS